MAKVIPAHGNSLTYKGKTYVARTVDGVEITDGLRVFTNNLDRGVVDLTMATWEWHGPEKTYHLWFYVNVDTKYTGEPVQERYLQSDDRVVTRFEGQMA